MVEYGVEDDFATTVLERRHNPAMFCKLAPPGDAQQPNRGLSRCMLQSNSYVRSAKECKQIALAKEEVAAARAAFKDLWDSMDDYSAFEEAYEEWRHDINDKSGCAATLFTTDEMHSDIRSFGWPADDVVTRGRDYEAKADVTTGIDWSQYSSFNLFGLGVHRHARIVSGVCYSPKVFDITKQARGAERRYADVADHFGFSMTVVRTDSAVVWRGFSRHVLPTAQWVRRVEEVEGALLHITYSGEGALGRVAATHACLSLALNAMGAHVPTSVQGPFRALEHGNQWLSHLGFALIRQPRGPTGPGRCVKWGPPRREVGLAASVGHFAAVILRPGSATVVDRRAGLPAVREWRARGDIPDEAARVSANRDEAMRRRSLRLFCPLPPVGWPSTQVPQVPRDFSLELPRLPKIRLLERLNARPRDAQLHFVEESHSYYIRGVRTHGSVTGLIHEYSRGFDAVAVIEKMRSGRNWPRPDYLRCPRPEYALAKLRTMPEAARLHDLLVSRGACDAEICAEVKATARAAPHLACLMESLSLSDQEIAEKRRMNKEEAARRGTWMHWTFEAHLNRVPVPRDAVEFQLFSKFLGALRGLAAFRTEWAIFAEHEGLAGSIDLVARDSAGSLYIYDWKRAKSLRSKFTNQWDNMKFPLSRLPDCQGNHYRAQLNIYRLMLEHCYGARVAAMSAVCLHPDNGDQPFVDDVPVIPEIEELMAIQRARSRELRAMASEDAREIDPAGGWRRLVAAARMPYCLSTAANFGRAFRRTSRSRPGEAAAKARRPLEVPLELPNADLQRLRIARVGSAEATVTAACSHASRKY
ncbi:unnamed protein product [Prorocentrum cordatum]|uniref:PD-(D/E)XK endonuclease-like domain-containing protein n=1 Tax=Prorocentrum cordatum TaxID=2364126 RepID=A0ABN9U4D2_9DINO|nr:unnamed protein product [Polarella glacialis]